MNPTWEARPRGGADRAQELSLLGCRDGSTRKISPSKNQAPCPIILSSQCRLTADLLGEAIEFAIVYGVAILAAVREADDEAIVASFRRFDAAARTARQCAEELRSLLGEAPR